MVKLIANQRIELNKEEYDYYLDLEKAFGKESFLGLFKSDKHGKIMAITPLPNQPVAMVIVFFFLNVMMNQRLRGIDDGLARITELERRLDLLEKK